MVGYGYMYIKTYQLLHVELILSHDFYVILSIYLVTRLIEILHNLTLSIHVVTQLIEILHIDNLIRRGAILLAIHPLKIGDRYTVSQSDGGSEDELNEDEADEDVDQGKESFAHYTPPPE